MKNIILEHALKIQNTVSKDLNSRFTSGSPFSLSLDEWTSLRNRKYLNINAHHQSGFFDCLGLSRAHGSLPALKLKELVQNHLSVFNLDLQQIVCVTTDGASVMEAFGRMLPCLHLKCQDHAVNLSVCDVLYTKKTKKRKAENNLQNPKKIKISKTFLEDEDISSDCCSDQNDENEIEDEVKIILVSFSKSFLNLWNDSIFKCCYILLTI